MKYLFRKWSLILLLSFMAFLGGMITGKVSVLADDKVYEGLQLFSLVFRLIETKYVEEVDNKNIIYGAIRGMVESLDPYSAFMTPEVYKELTIDTEGMFGGLGIEITIQDNSLTVLAPIEGTPAYKAGIKTGDKIVKINGESTEDYTIMEAVSKIRGPVGTSVTLTIMREGFEEPRNFVITRGVIRIQSVKGKTLEKGYGYIRITHFQANTSEDLENTLNKLEKENGGLKGLILDLRDNPGGLLDQAVEVVNKFIKEGLIVYTKGRVKEQNIEHFADGKGVHTFYPIIILVNNGSASASEIVAGSLQDYGKALILGTKTFGKGTVQTVIPLNDGSGLRLTTAKYYTPKGRDIQEKGIIPDIIVEQEAIYKEGEGEGGYIQIAGGGKIDIDKTNEKDDIQLKRALEILKSWEIFKTSSTLKK